MKSLVHTGLESMGIYIIEVVRSTTVPQDCTMNLAQFSQQKVKKNIFDITSDLPLSEKLCKT